MSLRGHDCNDAIPSMENWLNAESEYQGVIDPQSANTAPLFYDITQASTTTSTGVATADSLLAIPTLHKDAPLHPFLKLDTLELCKENPNAEVLVRTGSSSMVDSSSNEDEINSEHTSSRLPSSVLSVDQANLGMEADSPCGPLSPAELQLGMSPRPTSGSKRPFDGHQPSIGFAPFVTMAGSPPFLRSGANGGVAPAAASGIIFPAPLTLPTVPSLEEIAQSRPKRRNVRISKDPQSVAARHRRERISDRVRVLQHFVPGGTKMDTASMLDEAIQYVKFLQHQLQTLERLGNAYSPPRFTSPGASSAMMSTNAAARPFDLNCAVYYPSSSMMHAASPSSSQAQTSWQTARATNQFCNQAFPDSAQEQFCH